MQETNPGGEKQPRGINSIEVGYRVLEVLQQGRELPLKTIAERANLSASAAHNYLTSFVRTGMVRSDTRGRYSLGPSMAAFGMTAVRMLNKYETVQDAAIRLSDETGLGVVVLMWIETGTVVIFNRSGSRDWGIFDLRNGLVSTVYTGGGNVFIAHLDRDVILPVALREMDDGTLTEEECNRRLDEISGIVHSNGYASREIKGLPGYMSASAPILDISGDVLYALTLTAPNAMLNLDPTGPHVSSLLRTTKELSQIFGAHSAGQPGG